MALLAVVGIVGSLRVGIGWAAEGPRAGFFPFYISVIVLISCAVNLVNVLWGADGGCACGGIVREYTAEGARRRVHCGVWVEKRDGTKIIAGTASAVVG